MFHRSVALLLLSLTAPTLPGTSDAAELATPVTTESLPADPAQLRERIAELDRKMFDAYNAHDLDSLMAWFAPELEFYHDTGGLLGFEQVKAGFGGVFANNKDIRRELVPGSLEVYPVKDYGAIEVGAHRFCHTENGAPDCGTFRFVQVWRLKDGAWQVTRELSYGH